MEKIDKVKLALLDYDITAHSYIHRSGQGDCRSFASVASLGVFEFLKNGTLDLSETSASQRKEYNPSIILSKVLNSQMAITSSSYNDG